MNDASGVLPTRIVLTPTSPWPARGGPSAKLAALIDNWSVPVDVIMLGSSRPPPHVRLHQLPAGRLVRAGRITAILRGGLPSQARLPVRTTLRTLEPLLSQKLEFIHLDTMACAHLARPIRESLRLRNITAPVVVSINDSYSLQIADIPLGRASRGRIGRTVVQHAERRQLQHADVVDVVSPFDAGWLGLVAPRANIRVVPLGIAPAGAVDETIEPAYDILMFTAKSGASQFLTESVPSIRKTVPDLSIRMVGATPDATVLQQLQAVGGKYLGFVADLKQTVRQARCVVAPSQQRSGMSTKAITAMTLRVPVVGGRCLLSLPGSLPGVHYEYSATSAGLAAAAVRVLTDSSLAKSRLAAAADLVGRLPTHREIAEYYCDSLTDLRYER